MKHSVSDFVFRAFAISALLLVSNPGGVLAAPSCDHTVAAFAKDVTDSLLFVGNDISCDLANIRALKECMSKDYSCAFRDCATWRKNGYVLFYSTYIGRKYKTRKKSAEEKQSEKCEKISACETEYLNHSVTEEEMQNLMLIKREYGC